MSDDQFAIVQEQLKSLTGVVMAHRGVLSTLIMVAAAQSPMAGNTIISMLRNSELSIPGPALGDQSAVWMSDAGVYAHNAMQSIVEALEKVVAAIQAGNQPNEPS